MKKTIFNILYSVILFLFTSGCASTQVTNGLTALQGKHISVAFDVLGYPDSKMEIGSDTAYIWRYSNQSTLYMPQTSYHSGQVNGVYYSGTTSYNQPTTINGHATIKIIADYKDYIKTCSYSGNEYGLSKYAKSLGKYANAQKRLESEGLKK